MLLSLLIGSSTTLDSVKAHLYSFMYKNRYVVNITALLLPCALHDVIDTASRWHSQKFHTTNEATEDEVIVLYLLTEAAL